MPQNLVPNTAADQGDDSLQGRLSLVTDTDLLPKTLVGDIFSKAKGLSRLMQLGQQIPVSLNETVVPVPSLYKPAAGQVGGTTLDSREGATKPVTGLKYGSRTSFMPIKLAVIVTASREYALTNPDALWSSLASDLPEAIATAADLAVIHGKDALRGTTLSGIGTNGYVMETTNRIPFNPRAQRVVDGNGNVTTPDVIDQFIEGWRSVVAQEDTNYTLNNWAYAPEITPDIVTHRRGDGTPLWSPAGVPSTGSELNLNASVGGSILGINAVPSDMVHGKVTQQTSKTNARVIGGDWSQLAYGYADQISFRMTDSATLMGGPEGTTPISLWQTNQVAVLCEATFGWLVPDPDAFVVFEAEDES